MGIIFFDPEDNFPEKSHLNKALIIIILLIFIFTGSFILAIYLIKKSFINYNLNENISITDKVTNILFPEPAVIYKRGGEIIEIKNNYLVIASLVRTASNELNQTYQLKNLTVYFDSNTLFIKTGLTEYQQTKNVPSPQPSSLNELKVGDEVNVTAKENIKNLTEITANEIELIVK